MDRNSINDEIAMCNSILEKFKEELEDCKKDFETLKGLQPTEGNNPNFKKALAAVKERHDDIIVTVGLIKERLAVLTEEANA